MLPPDTATTFLLFFTFTILQITPFMSVEPESLLGILPSLSPSHFAFLPLGTTVLHQYPYIYITHMYIHYLILIIAIFDRFFIHK
jgi:hypothetical protein